MKSIFLSYSWADAAAAEQLDSAFVPTGVMLQREVLEFAYKNSNKTYVQTIRNADYVLLISDAFLKSIDCMSRILEVLNEKDHRIKIFPVRVEGTRIFTPSEKMIYTEYWQAKCQNLSAQFQEAEGTSAPKLYDELTHCQNINRNIDVFFTQIAGTELETLEGLISKDFKPLLDRLELRDKKLIQRILSLSSIEDKQERGSEVDKLDTEYPNTAQIKFVKGQLAYDNKMVEKSISYYQQAIDLNPEFASAHHNLAFNLAMHNEDYKLAAAHFKKSIELNPSAKAFQNYGLLLKDKLAQPDNAKIQFEKGLKLEPKSKIMLKQLGLIYQDHYKDFLTAKVYFDQLIELDPNSHDHYFYTLFLLLTDVKEYKLLARDHYRSACRLDPSLQNPILEQMMD